jgi:hypothetical protein
LIRQPLHLSDHFTRGGFHKKSYDLPLKFVLCATTFSTNLLEFGKMHLRLPLNLKHFLPDLGALYILRCAPNYYEIHRRNKRVKFHTNGVGHLAWKLYLPKIC